MAQTLDLGRSTLRIRDSKLQLHLAASAHFTQPPSHGTPQIRIDLAQFSNLESVWITEAPELELRFFVGGNWDRDKVAIFVSKLSSKLCDIEVRAEENLPNWKLTIPWSRSGRIWDSPLSSRRADVNIALTLLVSTASNLLCIESVEYGKTQGVGLCLVR